MKISIVGLVAAFVFLMAGIAQWYFLRKSLAAGLAAQRATLSGSMMAQRQAEHAKLLKALLIFDVVVLPVMGYTVGRLIFDS